MMISMACNAHINHGDLARSGQHIAEGMLFIGNKGLYETGEHGQYR